MKHEINDTFHKRTS